MSYGGVRIEKGRLEPAGWTWFDAWSWLVFWKEDCQHPVGPASSVLAINRPRQEFLVTRQLRLVCYGLKGIRLVINTKESNSGPQGPQWKLNILISSTEIQPANLTSVTDFQFCSVVGVISKRSAEGSWELSPVDGPSNYSACATSLHW
jgi:hypothetical protein